MMYLTMEEAMEQAQSKKRFVCITLIALMSGKVYAQDVKAERIVCHKTKSGKYISCKLGVNQVHMTPEAWALLLSNPNEIKQAVVSIK